MLKVLNSGEQFYRIHAQNADVRALKDIFDRMFGCPKQTQEVDMTVKGNLELVSG